MKTPWSYIKLSQLVSSIKQDLKNLDLNGFIDEDNFIKIGALCNHNLGLNIYKPKECMLHVSDFKSDIPSDLYKIESIFLSTINSYDFINSINSNTSELFRTNSCCYGTLSNKDEFGCFYWKNISPINLDFKIKLDALIPLKLYKNITSKCTDYCFNKDFSDYSVDFENEKFKFSFKDGVVYLSYLGNLENEDGEIELPFHPKLNPYYEYAIKEKILEDIFIGSEADVVNKLRYFTQKKSEAYAEAWNFVQTREVNEWSKIQKKLNLEYYHKWYKIFN